MNGVAGSLSDAPYPGYSGPGPRPSGLPPPSLRQAPPPGQPAASPERPRLRELRRSLETAAKPARRDRFARWHVPESTEQESEGWLLPYLDVLTLLLALLVALLALTRMDAARPDARDDDMRAAPPVMLVGSIGSGGLPGMPPPEQAGLPAIPADWAAPAGPDTALAPPFPDTTEPAGPGTAALVPVPQGTSDGAATPGIGGTDAASQAAGPAATEDAPAASFAGPAHDGAGPAPAADPAAVSMPPAGPAPEPPSIADLGLDELGDSVDVIVNAQSISFRISNELLFPPGQADLGPDGREVLGRLADIVNRTDYRISVEGHSDSVPIQNERYPSNWELSTARATSVLRQLERYGVAPARLSATGFAHTRPIASNGSVAGRAANRRVELIMQTGGRPQPLPPAPSGVPAAAGGSR